MILVEAILGGDVIDSFSWPAAPREGDRIFVAGVSYLVESVEWHDRKGHFEHCAAAVNLTPPPSPAGVWVPTSKEIETAGDALLEAVLLLRRPILEPEPGDLVIEVTSRSLDWERVGYLLEPVGDGPIVIWSLGGRVTRWSNAAVRRLGKPGARLQSLPFPSEAEIEKSK